MTPVAVKCPIRRSAPGEFGAGSALDEQRNEVPDPAVFKLGVGALDDGVDALGWTSGMSIACLGGQVPSTEELTSVHLTSWLSNP